MTRNRRLTITTPPPAPSDSSIPEVVSEEQMAWREISQIAANLRGLVKVTNNQAEFVKQIPEIKSDVKDAKQSARQALQKVEVVDTKLGTQLQAIDRRVGRVEDKGHLCKQEAVINGLHEVGLETRKKLERDIQEGVKTRERLDNTRSDLDIVDKEVKSFSTARRNFFMGILGVVVFGLSSVGSLIWFLSELNVEVENEQRERREGYKRLEFQLQKVGKTADTAPVQEKLTTLTQAVKAVNDQDTVEIYCSGLSDRAVRSMKRTVPQDEWPRCRRFGFVPP